MGPSLPEANTQLPLILSVFPDIFLILFLLLSELLTFPTVTHTHTLPCFPLCPLLITPQHPLANALLLPPFGQVSQRRFRLLVPPLPPQYALTPTRSQPCTPKPSSARIPRSRILEPCAFDPSLPALSHTSQILTFYPLAAALLSLHV
jgi:hypothetical protein